MNETFDYVVVGAGSGGCAVAGRLSEHPDISVCLLESGSGRGDSALVRAPAGIAAMIASPINNWQFKTVPQRHLNGRRGYQPRGRGLGGSSAINAMLYLRGHASDFDHWASLGNEGWSYEDVLPVFKQAEANSRGASEFHGADGPLQVCDQVSPNPHTWRFLEAGRQLQMPLTPDFNGAEQEGFGAFQVTQKNGERCSAAAAYILPNLARPNLARPNLTVRTKAHVSHILFDGKRTTGVRLRHGWRVREISARKGVILAAGVFQTPQLLMLSGIGPGAHLQEFGIDVRHDLPGVGENLQDHIDYVTAYKSPETAFIGMSAAGGKAILDAITQWRASRTGPLTSPLAEAGAFLKTNPDLPAPDIQLHFVTGIVDDHNRKMHMGHGYSCHVCVLRPKSRGTVRLASASASVTPEIDPRFLSDSRDLDTLAEGFKIMRRILEAPAFDEIRGKELHTADVHTDEDIRSMIAARADTIYHPVGTCRMGPDGMAVVDSRLKVHGLEGLHICDASIMPTIPGGNPNAVVMMIAERCARFIMDGA